MPEEQLIICARKLPDLLKGLKQDKPNTEFVNDDETPGDVNLVSTVATFC